MKCEREQQTLLKEAAAVSYRREHAAELIAEQVARAAWPEEEKHQEPAVADFPSLDAELDDHSFGGDASNEQSAIRRHIW